VGGGGQNITPTAANSQSAASAPTISYGGIDVVPTAADSTSAGTTPVISYGGIDVVPTAADSQSAGAAPTISYGGIDVVPTAADSSAAASAPTISYGAIDVVPTAANAQGAASTPTIDYGGIDVTPTAATAAATASSPTVSAPAAYVAGAQCSHYAPIAGEITVAGSFVAGSRVRISVLFTDDDGDPTDPVPVAFAYRPRAGGPVSDFVYGVDAELVRRGTGDYYVDLITPAPGQVTYEWEIPDGVYQGDYSVVHRKL
jgi:hypothetical protein